VRKVQHVTTRAHWQCITSISNTCIEHTGTDSRTSARAVAHTHWCTAGNEGSPGNAASLSSESCIVVRILVSQCLHTGLVLMSIHTLSMRMQVQRYE
jgi:hypothetical protein